MPTGLVFSQQRQIGINPRVNNEQINNRPAEKKSDGKKSNEGIDPKTGFPSYLVSKKINKGDLYELTIIIKSTEPYHIDKSSDFPFDEKLIKSSTEAEIHYSDARGQHYAIADFCALYKDKSGQILKITDYEETWVFKGKNNYTQNNNLRNFATSSVLSAGDWYKIGVIRDGIFKIDFPFLQSLGVDMTSLPSDAINIYGNSFGMLPEENSVYRPDDLLKNAIKIYDGGDGVFNSGDYLLFYAKGPNKWKVSTSFFEHEQNYFSDTSYYFINIDRASPNPKRVTDIQQSLNSPNQFVTSFNDYQVIEPEQSNFFKSGRQWFSNQLFQDVNQYSFNFPNIQVGAQCKIDANVVAKAPVSNVFFTLTENNSGQFQTVQLNGSASGDFYPNANIGYFFTASSPNINLTLSFNRNGMASANSWLDYIRVNVRRNLVFTGSALFFRDVNSVGVGSVSEFTLTSNNSSIEIWEVTSPSDAGRVNTPHNGTGYIFRLNTDSLREFVAFTGTTFAVPANFGKVQNQNIHGLPHADLIIVCPNFLQDEAEDLADLHRSKGLGVNVISVEEIFNEFSSGMRDATAIKTMMKMFYERGLPINKAPKYLTLLGDGSYDNRNKISRVSNLIPTYQSVESLNNFSTHTSDDYFGILGDTEGMNPKDLIDVAVGRIVAKNKTEARSVINKIKIYGGAPGLTQVGSCNLGGEQSSLRDWRNVFCFITDDPDAGLDFLPAVETWVSNLKSNHPEYNYVRIHSDAYKQISTPGGPRYPDVEEAIRKRVENGALVVDYVGHGGEVGWATERILDLSTINGWTNLYRLPLFMTATCEFSRYDDPGRVSAGEQLLLNPNGGAIALYSTTRVVFAQSNDNLNSIFCDTVLKRVNGKPQTIGEVFMGTKNRYATLYNDINFRKFQLLGDPALRIAAPKFQVITSHINDELIAGNIDTLNALRKITVKGFVADLSGVKLNNFTGIVYPTLFDKEQTITTLANDPWSTQRPFDVRNINLFKGKASVVNGEFEFTFIVPKDILFNYGNGRISYYAENGAIDANGYNEDIVVGGVYAGAQTDNVGPELTLYMNNENFVNGGLTNQNPVFFARFFDENGINTTGNGIGHDITAIINEATDRAIILNEFYEAELDDYQRGSVRYPFNKLEDGPHTLSLKAWDAYNNSSTKTIDFVVAENETVALTHVLNYPNPFTTSTEFFFEHNQNCSNLQVQLQIFSIAGNLVKTINQRVNMNGFRSEGIPWNGRDDYGDQLAKGVYIYRLKVITESGESAEKLEKLVVLK